MMKTGRPGTTQRHGGGQDAKLGQREGELRGDEFVALQCSRLMLLIWTVVSRVFGSGSKQCRVQPVTVGYLLHSLESNVDDEAAQSDQLFPS
jgi:hypothetical protein